LWDASKLLGIKECTIINDFVAQACACASPIADNTELIIDGEADRTRAIAVVGAGTGLGQAYLIPDGCGGFIPGASEGGHVNFAPESREEFEFLEFGCRKFGCEYLTMEHVVSGRGLSLVHQFLTGESLAAHEVAATFDDKSQTAQWLSRFYGRACRNFALSVLARGGVFVAGGIAAKNPMLVKHQEFVKAFQSSPTHEGLLRRIPVRLNVDQESGLWGGAFSLAMR
jgi:glucokinase